MALVSQWQILVSLHYDKLIFKKQTKLLEDKVARSVGILYQLKLVLPR